MNGNQDEIDLAVLLKDVADDADFEARGRDRTVRIIRDEPLTIRGVFELVRSAIENVVRNAVRYTDAGTQVDIALTSETINRDRCAVITVRDHGKGVPEESIKEIFRPFYRVEDDRDRKTGGTGLGLSIAARAVRLHQGTIKATNVEDGGLIVEIRLPIDPRGLAPLLVVRRQVTEPGPDSDRILQSPCDNDFDVLLGSSCTARIR